MGQDRETQAWRRRHLSGRIHESNCLVLPGDESEGVDGRTSVTVGTEPLLVLSRLKRLDADERVEHQWRVYLKEFLPAPRGLRRKLSRQGKHQYLA